MKLNEVEQALTEIAKNRINGKGDLKIVSSRGYFMDLKKEIKENGMLCHAQAASAIDDKSDGSIMGVDIVIADIKTDSFMFHGFFIGESELINQMFGLK